MNTIKWKSGRGVVQVNGVTDQELCFADQTVSRVLKDRNIQVVNDWDAYFMASAQVSDEDIAAIRAAVADSDRRRNEQARQTMRCRKCGSSGPFTTLRSQGICDDCA